MDGPRIQRLTGDRLHLHHGPIDVVLKVWGTPAESALAEAAAIRRFSTILGELVSELAELRQPIGCPPFPRKDGERERLRGRITSPVGRRMVDACSPYGDVFITPMAAVAGAVADELMATMLTAAPGLIRAFVNDGGDIAVHLAAGEVMDIAVAGDFMGGDSPAVSGKIVLCSDDGVGGIATSGARGRSFSLGIADSVTVLATDAAAADAAATLIANAVDIDDAAIERRSARDLDPDSDLGHRLVTVRVPPLCDTDVARALARGLQQAEMLRQLKLIVGALLQLQGQARVCSAPASKNLFAASAQPLESLP